MNDCPTTELGLSFCLRPNFFRLPECEKTRSGSLKSLFLSKNRRRKLSEIKNRLNSPFGTFQAEHSATKIPSLQLIFIAVFHLNFTKGIDMKNKLIFAILAATLSTGAMAADKFTGASVGLDVEAAKYKDKVGGLSSKNSGSAVLKGDVGFDYGNNFVGIVEARAKLNSSTILKENEDFSGKFKQKDRYSIGYAQGYRVTSDLMPYVKAEYQNSKLAYSDAEYSTDFSKRYNGFGVGVGAKYAVTDNIEVGAEYVRSRLKKGDDKLSGNAFSAGVAYRFK